MEIQLQTENLIGIQETFYLVTPHLAISGIFDRLYTDHFVEVKFTTKPENYSTPFNLLSQIGTYFLASHDSEYCVVEVIRVPGLRERNGEEPRDFRERCYQDIVSRPSKYFIGYDKKKNTFGRRFYRGEFDLDELRRRYEWVADEIRESIKRGSWYQRETGCFAYGGVCDFYQVCETGIISETIYEKKPEKKE